MAKVLLKGNEALAEAALAAGCRFYSGYPITPQTEILEYLSWRMEDVGGTFIQAESELAGYQHGSWSSGSRGTCTDNFIRPWIFPETGRNFIPCSSRPSGSYR